MQQNKLKAICFYLPQFHPIPENDEWWGKGFTEWTNVAKAKPRFPGHYQPHIPADLGFYDLRLAETREAQADLARIHGIHGFCYYHYWFNGRRVLEKPFNEVLATQKPDFPFCLCWANENWTRIWDGSNKHILLQQHYSHEDDQKHIQSLLPAFLDKRYIRVNDKPLFLVYRTASLPNPRKTVEIWQEEALKAGLNGLYLVSVESHLNVIKPNDIGFDAATEFAPYGERMGKHINRTIFHRGLSSLGLISNAYFKNRVISYETIRYIMLAKPPPDYTHFKSVTPSWDNSPRRENGALIFIDSTPKKYEEWLLAAKQITINNNKPDEQLVFINAWNEWAEGNHLEPDQRWGKAYLEATRSALESKNESELLKKIQMDKFTADNSPLNKKIFWRILNHFK